MPYPEAHEPRAAERPVGTLPRLRAGRSVERGVRSPGYGPRCRSGRIRCGHDRVPSDRPTRPTAIQVAEARNCRVRVDNCRHDCSRQHFPSRPRIPPLRPALVGECILPSPDLATSIALQVFRTRVMVRSVRHPCFFLRLISHSARSLPHVIARLDRALSMRPSFDVVSRGMGRMECLVNHHPCSSQPSHTRQRVVPPPPAARGRRRASCPRAVSRQRVPASAFERLPAGASPAMMRSGRGRARRRPLRERLRACDPARACCIPRGSPVAEEAPAMNAVGSFPRPAGGSVCTKRVRAGGPALPAPDLPPRGHGRLRAVGRPAFPGYPAYEPSTRRCPLACPTGAGPAARPFPPARFAPLGHRPCLYATSPAGARGRASGDSGNSAPRSTEPAG